MNTAVAWTHPGRIPDPEWWRQAVVYEIYPRSFADSNADGLGDLRGVATRIDYLESLRVDAIWLTPFYPSALADGGYDVDDYRDVDPRLGTLADFDDLLDAVHRANIKLVIDIVPNHTSDRHEWFREAMSAAPGSPARDRYIFRDGYGPDRSQPPADWTSSFGGPAWSRTTDGQWYLHQFSPQQPDLNWNNHDVRADFLRTLRFWADRGVDGFRVDVAHLLAKDLTEPLPTQAMLDATEQPGAHRLRDRDEVHDIYTEWRQVLNEYDPPRTAVAEAWVPAARRARYASRDGLGQAFNFDLLTADWDPEQFRSIISRNLAHTEQASTSSTWVLSNHDSIRHATRYGLNRRNADLSTWSGDDGAILDEDLGTRRARAAALLMLALPGSAYLYQGEELGLHEVTELPAQARQDPVFQRTKGARKGRDGCRVPLPWTTTGPSYGFGTGPAHLPQPAQFSRASVQAQHEDPDSTLNLYREALNLRSKLQTGETLRWIPHQNQSVLHFARPNQWNCITNFDHQPAPLPTGMVVLTSSPLDDDHHLPADTTAWCITPNRS